MSLTRFCATEVAAGTEFISTGNTLLLQHESFDYTGSFISPYKGFQGTISHVSTDEWYVHAIGAGFTKIPQK